jgi:hypothetical protein
LFECKGEGGRNGDWMTTVQKNKRDRRNMGERSESRKHTTVINGGKKEGEGYEWKRFSPRKKNLRMR